jgi:hypothetical protein
MMMAAKLKMTNGTKIPFTGSLINHRDWRRTTCVHEGSSAGGIQSGNMGHTEGLQCQHQGIKQKQFHVEEEYMFDL